MSKTSIGIIGILVLLSGIGAYLLTVEALGDTASFCQFAVKNLIGGECYSYWSGFTYIVTGPSGGGGATRPLGLLFALIVILGIALIIIALRSDNHVSTPEREKLRSAPRRFDRTLRVRHPYGSRESGLAVRTSGWNCLRNPWQNCNSNRVSSPWIREQ